MYIPPVPSLPPGCDIVWNAAIEHATVVAAQRPPERTIHRPQPLPPTSRVISPYTTHKAHYRAVLGSLPIGTTFTLHTFAPDTDLPPHLITLYSSQAVLTGRLAVVGMELRVGGGSLVQRYAVVALAEAVGVPVRAHRRRRVA
jgi:hypothetical protein